MNVTIKRRNGHFYSVIKSTIIGTNFTSYEVVEPLRNHRSVSYTDNVGWLVSRPLPANLDKLPAFSDERMRRISRFHKQLDKLHALVLKRAGLNLVK